MGNDNRAIFERTTKFYAESATEWQLKLIVWEFFCTLTWSGRARNCVRKRRTHVTRWLGYWARTVRPAVADPLGHLAFVIRWERGEIGGLPRCHILISRFPERSINPSTCFAMVNTWKHGISQVRLYDPNGPGVRQELKRFQRKGLGYSKDLETHKLAVALHFGVYNFVRQHHTLGTTPAVAAGLEEKPWSLEQVVEMTDAYWLRKKANV